MLPPGLPKTTFAQCNERQTMNGHFSKNSWDGHISLRSCQLRGFANIPLNIDLFGLAKWGAVTSISLQALPVAQLRPKRPDFQQAYLSRISMTFPSFLFNCSIFWDFAGCCTPWWTLETMQYSCHAALMLVDAGWCLEIARCSCQVEVTGFPGSPRAKFAAVMCRRLMSYPTEDVRDERQALHAVAGWFVNKKSRELG